jgi:two-component system, cell cycle response regulator
MELGQNILVVDPDERTRVALADRLRSLGYRVTLAGDGVEGAHQALAEPPAAVVADLVMPNISGVQLCRLLHAEPATSSVPIVLRGPDGRRNRFWAEQAGAVSYVVKGRTGDLVRVLRKSIASRPREATAAAGAANSGDIRDRIAAYLDAALFDSVIAAEVRKLGVCDSFDRLFDLLVQFASQVTAYRWLAVALERSSRAGLHASPNTRHVSEAAARVALGLAESSPMLVIEDDDAIADAEGPPPLVVPVMLGERRVGRIALGPREGSTTARSVIEIFARELGGPLQTALLMEESQRLAKFDSLTGRLNRRAFMEEAQREVERVHRYSDSLSLLLIDIDHFKLINDRRGHASGDCALREMGRLIGERGRKLDIGARWGGEEFVVAMPSTSIDLAAQAAERLRQEIEQLQLLDANGEPLSFTVSIGVAELQRMEEFEAVIDRADRAMYRAKMAGRNQVHCARATDGEPVFERVLPASGAAVA